MNMFPKPEECMSIEDQLRQILADRHHRMKPKIKEYLQREIEENMLNAIEFRSVKLEPSTITGFNESSLVIFRSLSLR